MQRITKAQVEWDAENVSGRLRDGLHVVVRRESGRQHLELHDATGYVRTLDRGTLRDIDRSLVAMQETLRIVGR